EMAFQLFVGRESIKYESEVVTDVNLVPVSYEFIDIQKLQFESGRFYSESEANSGSPVVVLGYEVAKNLFGDSDPLDKKVRLYGQRMTVIGVLKKQGSGMFGESNDLSAYIPVNFVRRLYGDNNEFMTPVILIKPETGTDMASFKAELAQKL